MLLFYFTCWGFEICDFALLHLSNCFIVLFPCDDLVDVCSNEKFPCWKWLTMSLSTTFYSCHGSCMLSIFNTLITVDHFMSDCLVSLIYFHFFSWLIRRTTWICSFQSFISWYFCIVTTLFFCCCNPKFFSVWCFGLNIVFIPSTHHVPLGSPLYFISVFSFFYLT